jgi:hypothetical protein
MRMHALVVNAVFSHVLTLLLCCASLIGVLLLVLLQAIGTTGKFT